MKDEREVAGLRCSAVLAQLSSYLDGELAPAARAAVEAHVRGCDACTRFGGAFAGVVRRLRVELGADTVPDAVRARLDAALRDA
jgi:anti-sigma factor RsiW